MPEEGGTPCPDGASEETTKCDRKCHDPVYCVWTKWEDEGACSVTCGQGTIKRVRYLQATKVAPLEVISDSQVYSKESPIFEPEGRRRELVLSFASGGFVSFIGVMFVMLALRSRQPYAQV